MYLLLPKGVVLQFIHLLQIRLLHREMATVREKQGMKNSSISDYLYHRKLEERGKGTWAETRIGALQFPPHLHNYRRRPEGTM